MNAAGWSSLEVAKLLVAAATPVLVILLGVVVSRAAHRLEQAQWANRKLIERRLELYDELAEGINDLYCFFALVGHFRDIAPPDVVPRKRELDKIFFVNEFLMGERFGEHYRAFIHACFDMYTGFAQDAKLRSSIAAQRTERRDWDPAWDTCFVADPADVTPTKVIHDRYRALMQCFAVTIGVQPVTEPGPAAPAAG